MAYIPPLTPGQATSANSAPVVLSTSQEAILSQISTNTGAQATDFISSGTITALNGTVSVTGQGVYTVTASVTGTWVGTLVFEGQLADSTWQALPANLISNTLPFNTVSSTSTNGAFAITGGGFSNIRIRASAYTSGTVAVALNGSLAQQTILANQIGTWSSQISDGSTPATKASVSAVPALRTSNGLVVTPAQQKLFRCTFANVQSGVDSTFFNTIVTGSGQTVNQSAGNLVITAGTTINTETILRSVQAFTGNTILRAQSIFSQRIINQNFYIELVDVVGDSLTASATSATSITITIPNNPFTSANVGQSMYIGVFSGGLTGVPGRYAIASVSGNNVTFTVAGFTVSSGTCSLFGWNYYQSTYNSAGATTAQYDSQRRGWNSGNTGIGTNTTASPGHMLIMGNEDGNSWVADQLVASGTAAAVTLRGSRVINLPEESTQLYLQIRVLNGSSAPASSTTWTIGTVSVENYTSTPISSYNVKPQGLAQQMSVAVTNTPAVTVSSGTVTTVSTVTALSAVNSVATTNGLTLGTLVSPTTPAANSIKATAGRLLHMHVGNPNTSAVYLKIYNVAAPTLGTTAANMNYYIPASSSISIPINDIGLFFSTAIVTAVTGGATLTDNTAITTGCVLNYSWI